MAKLNGKDVKHVAKLSRLKLDSKEIKKFGEQLSSVIARFEELKEVDTDKTEPTAQTTGLVDVLRPDEIDPTQTLSQEQALSGTEKTHNGYFVVPALINKK